ncbi:MAG: hypothetical protein PHE93_03150 [Clostridia bacterium]|nr:hypothetical protein [Clostridia bacterium]
MFICQIENNWQNVKSRITAKVVSGLQQNRKRTSYGGKLRTYQASNMKAKQSKSSANIVVENGVITKSIDKRTSKAFNMELNQIQKAAVIRS